MNTYYPPSTDLKFVKTTREEERELFRKMKAGDAQARETIIKHHLLFVAIVARKCANPGTNPFVANFQDDEIVSAANEALIQAIDRKQFDETRGYRFTSYLRPFIRGAISKMWRERAKFVNLPDESAISNVAAGVETTEDHPVEENEFQAFMLKALENGKSGLTEREQLVLSLMYEQGMNGAQIGRQLKMTRERVRQIHEEILSKLRKAMHKQGIDRR